MPLVAEDVIRDTRALDPSFTEQRHPARTLLRALSRIQRRLVGELAKIDKSVGADTFDITLPLSVFADGAALEDPPGTVIDITSIHRPLDMFVGSEVLPRDLDLVDWSDRHRVAYVRAAYLRGNRLYLSGIEDDWKNVTKIVLTYTPTPATLVAATPLVLPLTAEDTLLRHLAAFMAGRSKQSELARPRAEFLVDAAVAEASWRAEARGKRGVTVSVTRSDW